MFSFSFDFRQQFRLKKLAEYVHVASSGIYHEDCEFPEKKKEEKKIIIVFILLGRHIYLVLNLWLQKEPSKFASLFKLLIIFLDL